MRRKRWRFDPCVGKIPGRRSRQPTPVSLRGKSHGQRRLAGYIPWGHKESNTTEATWHANWSGQRQKEERKPKEEYFTTTTEEGALELRGLKKVFNLHRRSLSLCYSLQPDGLYSPWNSPGQNTGVGSWFLLQRIFPAPGSNRGLLQCRQILYCLSH